MLSNRLDINQLQAALVTPGFLTAEEFKLVMTESSHSGKNPGQIILEKSYLTNKELTKVVADFLHLGFIDIAQVQILPDVLETVPQLYAQEHLAVAFAQDEQGLSVALADPLDQEVIDHLQKFSDHTVRFFAAPEEDLENIVQTYPHDYLQQLRNLVVNLSKVNSAEPGIDQSVIELVDTVIIFALANRASDIHLEPYAHRLLVRFRVDGTLHHIIDLPETLNVAVFNRLKLMSKMKTDQKNTPQDGKIDFTSGRFAADIRASVAPLITGEKMVLRLLGHRHRAINLTDLGLSSGQLKIIVAAAAKKQGMIVVCGPTGAGKTTTLYALMKRLNSEQVNIATVEDPVEYDLEGVNQIQVNPTTGLTYTEGLKITLRQDPDIIMLSAIRDLQTANLANVASLSGHVVLTTLDTPDAVGAIARLLEMQIEAFPLATSLNLIIGQRLVRTICQNCRLSYDLSDAERELVAGQLKINAGQVSKRLYRGKGCSQCGNTGYRGRIGIFEILTLTETVKKLIIDKADISQIFDQAKKDGLVTLREDGIQKVLAGITTAEELLSELSL